MPLFYHSFSFFAVSPLRICSYSSSVNRFFICKPLYGICCSFTLNNNSSYYNFWAAKIRACTNNNYSLIPMRHFHTTYHTFNKCCTREDNINDHNNNEQKNRIVYYWNEELWTQIQFNLWIEVLIGQKCVCDEVSVSKIKTHSVCGNQKSCAKNSTLLITFQ